MLNGSDLRGGGGGVEPGGLDFVNLRGEVAVHEVGHEVEVEDLPRGDVADGCDEGDQDAAGEGAAEGDLAGEGSGIALVRDGVVVEGTLAGESAQGNVYQAMAPMATAARKVAVFGSWLVDGEPAGMGVRESKGPVTNNTSSFVPHYFR